MIRRTKLRAGAFAALATVFTLLSSLSALPAANATTTPMSVSWTPTSATAGVPVTYGATFTANTGMSGGTVSVTIPKGWTAPHSDSPSTPGFVSWSNDVNCPSLGAESVTGSGPWVVTVGGISCLVGGTITFNYTQAGATKAGAYTFASTVAPTGGKGVKLTSTVAVAPAPVTTFKVSPTGASTVTAGGAYGFKATAYDQFNNVATNFTGNIAFSSTDTKPSTQLPPPSTLTNGTGTFSASPTTAGKQSITVRDQSNAAAHGTVNLTVLPAPPMNLTFTPPAPGPAMADVAIPNVAVAVVDAFGNVESGLSTGTVTMSVTPGSPQASFTSGTTTVGVVKGLARFTNLTVHNFGGYQITATPGSIGDTTARTSDWFYVSRKLAVTPASVSTPFATPFSKTLNFSGGDGTPITSSASGLPSWVTYDPTTRTLSGNPGTMKPATSTFDLTVTDSPAAGPADTHTFAYKVTVARIASPFHVNVDGTTSESIQQGASATLAANDMPVPGPDDPAIAGTVKFVTSAGAELCHFAYPAFTSCGTDPALASGTYDHVVAKFTDTDGYYASSTSSNALSLTVTPAGAQTITFSTTPPSNPTVGGDYTVGASSSSGLEVLLTIDPTSQSVCSIDSNDFDGSVAHAHVVFNAADTCVIDADQPGNESIQPAPRVQQTVTFGHSSVALPVKASGWKFTQVDATNAGNGFAAPLFDDSTWTTGTAGFGNLGGCSWNVAPTVGTDLENWGNSGPTDIYIRHHLTIPAGATNVHIEGTIDNDATVWLNGHPVSGPGGVDALDITDGSCHSDGINIFVPSAAVVGGDNVLVIRARNDGGPAFVDVSVVYTPAANSQTITFTPPTSGVSGTSIDLSSYASAGASGNPVVFSIDANSDPVCSLGDDGKTLSFVNTFGSSLTCIVDANEAGNDTYGPAPQEQRAIVVDSAT